MTDRLAPDRHASTLRYDCTDRQTRETDRQAGARVIRTAPPAAVPRNQHREHQCRYPKAVQREHRL